MTRHQWSAEEDGYLLAAAQRNVAVDSIAVTLGRTPEAVKGRLAKLGHRNERLWSPVEDEYLAANYDTMALPEMAIALARTEKEIRQHFANKDRGDRRLDDLLLKVQLRQAAATQTRFHAGLREDIGINVRSGWEANVARWFNAKGIGWEYEPRTFYFDVRRGARSYLPDFWLPELDQWIEVKGYLKSSDKTKIKRFQKYCPTEAAKLLAIPKNAGSEAAKGFEALGIPAFAYYDDIATESYLIPGWE